MKHLGRALALLLCCLILLCACGKETTKPQEPTGAGAMSAALCSVVSLTTETEEAGEEIAGSGVILQTEETGGAYIATNLHVVDTPEAGAVISARLYGAEKNDAYPAQLLSRFPEYDVAVLYCENLQKENETVRAATIREEAARFGEQVFAIGNALGKGLAVTQGLVSVDSEYVSVPVSYQLSSVTLRQIRTDAEINQGCSGGGLFDQNGNLIGMINARNKKEGAEAIGYAIPANIIRALTKKTVEARRGGRTVALFDFGAVLEDNSVRHIWSEETHCLERHYTVTVTEIRPGSAAGLFLEPGDVLSGVRLDDGSEIPVTAKHLPEELFLSVGEASRLYFTYLRAGETRTFELPVTGAYLKAPD